MTDDDVTGLRPHSHRWQRVPSSVDNRVDDGLWFGAWVRNEPGRHPLRAIVSIDIFDRWDLGAGQWLHLSVSRSNRLPTWADLCTARDELGYADRTFVQLVPPTSYWLNVAGHVLHLLSRVDGPTVPRVLWDQDFADGRHYGKPAALDGKV